MSGTGLTSVDQQVLRSSHHGAGKTTSSATRVTGSQAAINVVDTNVPFGRTSITFTHDEVFDLVTTLRLLDEAVADMYRRHRTSSS